MGESSAIIMKRAEQRECEASKSAKSRERGGTQHRVAMAIVPGGKKITGKEIRRAERRS